MREFRLIEEIRGANPGLAACGGAEVLVPPGDDMALVGLRGRRALFATDQVIAGRHFAPGTPMRLVARKALARNVSDVAAMGGVPSCAVAAAALPPDLPDADARALADGFREAGREFRCPVVGGDLGTHAAPGAPLVIAVSILAEPGPTGRVVTRSGARPGDLLCVTGAFGGGWHPDGSGRHLAFVPRVAEALGLVEALGDRLHAMIDVSDGLGQDAAHLAVESGADAWIDAERIPCAQAVDWRRAIASGEDYELAFACDGPPPAVVAGTPVTVIGRFEALRGAVPAARVRHHGAEIDVSSAGWEHGR